MSVGVKGRTRVIDILLIAALVAAGPIPAFATETHQFDVPAEDAPSAIRDFASQAHVQILVAGENVKEKRLHAVAGQFSTDQALRLLLADSGLAPHYTGDRSIALVSAANSNSSPQTTGEGNASSSDSAKRDQKSSLDRIRVAQAGPTSAGPQVTSSDDQNAEKTKQEKDEEISEIVVTGTHIRGSDPIGSPILKFTREDIQRTGVATLNEFIDLLPQNFAGGPNEGTDQIQAQKSGGNESGGVAANLRGLGSGTTLTLLNGHRLAQEGGTFVDLSMIPVNAIERVELLTDGASAIYGSDAIGGVVNIILRKDLRGAETSARFGSDLKDAVNENQLDQSVGFGWPGGSALVSYEFYHRDALRAGERDFASQTQDPTAPTLTLEPNRTLLPDQRRHSVFLTANQDVGDRVKLNGDAFYSKRDADITSLSAFDIQSKVEQFGVSGSADFNVGAGWSVQLAPSFGENRFRSFEQQPDLSFPLHSVNRDRTTEVDFKADGPIWALPAGNVLVAAGGSYRSDHSSLDIPSETTSSKLGRNVKSAFTELSIPLIAAANAVPFAQRVNISLAARYDDYSDFGRATNPKIGVQYSPVSALQLRGSFSRAYRAPFLQDLQQTPGFVLFDAPDPASQSGSSLTLFNASNGNAHLRPETAKTWTAGFDVTPTSIPLRVTATYYSVTYQNIIAIPDTGTFFFALQQPDIYSAIITRNPGAAFVNGLVAGQSVYNGPNGFCMTGTAGCPPIDPASVQAYVDDQIQNIAVERQRSIDLTASYDFDTSMGRFNWSANCTRILSFTRQITPTAQSVSYLDRFELPIDLRIRTQVAWTLAEYGAMVAANYQGHYVDDVATPPAELKSLTTFDAQLSYRFAQSNSAAWLNGFIATLNVRNIFDTDPPFTLSAFDHRGYDAANANPIGRFISIGLTKRW